MEKTEIEQLLIFHGNKLPFEGIGVVRESLQTADAANANLKFALMKDPTISIILSVLLGQLGIDRIYIGDTLYGVLKFITCGGLGVWWLVDIFLIMDATKQKNLELFLGTKTY